MSGPRESTASAGIQAASWGGAGSSRMRALGSPRPKAPELLVEQIGFLAQVPRRVSVAALLEEIAEGACGNRESILVADRPDVCGRLLDQLHCPREVATSTGHDPKVEERCRERPSIP